jgi:hypothetical protein
MDGGLLGLFVADRPGGDLRLSTASHSATATSPAASPAAGAGRRLRLGRGADGDEARPGAKVKINPFDSVIPR